MRIVKCKGGVGGRGYLGKGRIRRKIEGKAFLGSVLYRVRVVDFEGMLEVCRVRLGGRLGMIYGNFWLEK